MQHHLHSPKHQIVIDTPRHVKGWRPGLPGSHPGKLYGLHQSSPPALGDMTGGMISVSSSLPLGLTHAVTSTIVPVPSPALPTTVDLRQFCPPINDQGDLGSCTANATAEALEFDLIKTAATTASTDPLYASLQSAAVQRFSRLFIYWYSRHIEGVPPTEDSGCVVPDVIRALTTYGACFESTWPYVDDGKDFTIQPTNAAYLEAQKHKLLLSYRCPTLPLILASMTEGYPVVLGFTVFESMMSDEVAKTGVISMPEPNEEVVGGHCVLAVGYDIVKDTILIQNSWGEDWGMDGFGTLPADYIRQGLAQDGTTLRKEMVSP